MSLAASRATLHRSSHHCIPGIIGRDPCRSGGRGSPTEAPPGSNAKGDRRGPPPGSHIPDLADYSGIRNCVDRINHGPTASLGPTQGGETRLLLAPAHNESSHLGFPSPRAFVYFFPDDTFFLGHSRPFPKYRIVIPTGAKRSGGCCSLHRPPDCARDTKGRATLPWRVVVSPKAVCAGVSGRATRS